MMLEIYLLVAIVFFFKGNSTCSSTYLYAVGLLLFMFLDYITTFLFMFIYLRYVLYSLHRRYSTPRLGVATYILIAMSIDAT
jgi:hypothetical protein